MLEELKQSGRGEPKSALEWWHAVECSTVTELRKRRLDVTPLFIELARAFLCIQSY